MIKKLFLSLVMVLCAGVVFAGSEGSTTFGGQMRFLPYDLSTGTHTYTNTSGTAIASTTARDVGMALDYVVLSIHHTFSDTFAVEFDPTYQASTGAYSVFGKDIGAQQSIAAKLFDIQNWDNAKMIFQLKDGYQLSAGIMRNKLTWDYGEHLSWIDSLVETKFSVSSDAVWLDSGLELKKTYDVADTKVPMTFMLLNGGTNMVDNNQSLAWLVKAEPVLYGVKWEASFYNNLQSNGSSTDIRYAVGAEYENGPLYLRGEYIQSTQQGARVLMNQNATTAKATTNVSILATANNQVGNDDKSQNGYNLIARYLLSPGFKVQAIYATYTNNNNSNGSIAYATDTKETYRDLALSAIYTVAKDFDINLTYQMSNFARTDSGAPSVVNTSTGGANASETLDFTRIILGTRIFF